MPFPVERVEETRPWANIRVGRDMRDGQENDFRVEFTLSRRDFWVAQLVSKGSVPFAWSMNEGSPQRCRIEDLNGLITISFLGNLCRLEARETRARNLYLLLSPRPTSFFRTFAEEFKTTRFAWKSARSVAQASRLEPGDDSQNSPPVPRRARAPKKPKHGEGPPATGQLR